MKKTILTALITFMVLPSMAQYEGEGFYRIQNKGAAKRYISIINNTVPERDKNVDYSTGYDQIITVWSLATVKDPFSDPGTVLYISGDPSNLALEAKGMSTKKLLGQYKLQAKGDELFSEAKGIEVHLIDDNEAEIKDNAATWIVTAQNMRKYNYGTYALWDFKKIDNKEQYFGVAPKIKIEEKFYTTLFTSFAYELPDGIKAYYVDDHEFTNVAAPVAELKEIEDIVPAATPVILECSSDKVEDNILKPLVSSDAPATVSNNELSGIYFCGYLLENGKEELYDQESWYKKEWKNVTTYNEETMRVLGTDAEGNLALIPATNDELVVTDLGKYLPANRAYFKIKSSEAEITKKGIALLGKADFDTATAIQKITESQETKQAGIYTLTGARVSEGNTTDGLPKGIYIINGKKVVVR